MLHIFGNRKVTFMRRDIFQAIADPIRREIIELVSEDFLNVNRVAERFAISRPAVSKHLRILEECGVVEVKKVGRERLCRINPKTLIPAFMWIDQYRRLWEEKIDSFEDYVLKLESEKQIKPNNNE